MAFRRKVWESLGGFDEALGAGTRFQAGEETDFCLRALLRGHAVLATPRVAVVHNGFRHGHEGARLVRAYWYGTGAVFAKLLRCGHVEILSLLARLGWRFLFEPSPIALSLMGPATRWARVRAFLAGAWAAARLPIDAPRGAFLD